MTSTEIWRAASCSQSPTVKSSLNLLPMICMLFLLLPFVHLQAANLHLTGYKSVKSDGEKLTVKDQGQVIAKAMAGSWEYGVYLLGLPVGLKAKDEVLRDGHQLTVKSQINHFLASNKLSLIHI